MESIMARSLSIFQTDHQSSVITSITEGVQEAIQFTPFGYTKPAEASRAIGYTGQLCEKGLGWYMLGNGHRVYNPLLRRFHSADSLSPFDRGGLNAYAYVLNNPVNLIDPDGRNPLKYALSAIGIAKSGLAGIHSTYKMLKEMSSNPLIYYTITGYALKTIGEVFTTTVETVKINQTIMSVDRASSHMDYDPTEFGLTVAYAVGKTAGLVGEAMLLGVSAAAHFGGGTNVKAKSAEQGGVNRSLLDNPPADTAPPRPTSLHLTLDSPSASPSSLRGKPSTRGRGRGRGSRTPSQTMSSMRTEQ